MSAGGRPRALDDAKRREICALISVGCGIELAAEYVGCSTTTIRREALRNDDFRQQFRNAQTASQLNPLRAVQKAASTHWRAAAWLLERTNPMRFGRRQPDHFTPDEVWDVTERFSEMMKQRLMDGPDGKRILSILEGIRHEVMRDAYANRRLSREARRTRRRSQRIARRELMPPAEQNPVEFVKTDKDSA